MLQNKIETEVHRYEKFIKQVQFCLLLFYNWVYTSRFFFVCGIDLFIEFGKSNIV